MMMVWQFPVITIVVLLLTVVPTYAAQTEPDVSHCLDLSAQPVPLAEVEFDGIIFTSHSDGTRAIRNPLSTTYVIGYSDHYRSFASLGSFSPDGQWFAFPSGTSRRANWSDRDYRVERINFINTYTGQRVFYVPFDGYFVGFVSRSYPIRPEFATRQWLSNTHYYLDENTVINVEIQGEEPYNGEPWHGIISPDGTQMLAENGVIDIASGEIILETEHRVHWLADGTGFYIRIQSDDQPSTTIYNQDGSLRFSYDADATVSHTGRWLAWDERTGEYPDTVFNFFILNTETGQITELCTSVGGPAFSPDDTQAAILTSNGNNRSRLWIIDLDTWQATPIDIQLEQPVTLVGWWAL